MALYIPGNFKNDIQGRDTNLVPVVDISLYPGDYDAAGENMYISTNSGSVAGKNPLPLLLNIPSLKESIDIEKRKYKISSVTLDISNAPYNGQRFSDLVGDLSLINHECRIFWTSPSTKAIHYFDVYLPSSPDEKAFQIYYGTIRRYTHDDEKVTITVEDRSQSKLHRDLPDTILDPSDPLVPDAYKNKRIPIVYGHVDKSPGVIEVAPPTNDYGVDAGTINLIFDSSTDSITFPMNINLFTHINDYVGVAETMDESVIADAGTNILGYPHEARQYYGSTLGTNIVQLLSSPSDYTSDDDAHIEQSDFQSISIGNPISDGFLAVRSHKTPTSGVTVAPSRHISEGSGTSVLFKFINSGLKFGDFPIDIVGTIVEENEVGDWGGGGLLGGITHTVNGFDLNLNNSEDLIFPGIGAYVPSNSHLDTVYVQMHATAESIGADTTEVYWHQKSTLHGANSNNVGTPDASAEIRLYCNTRFDSTYEGLAITGYNNELIYTAPGETPAFGATIVSSETIMRDDYDYGLRIGVGFYSWNIGWSFAADICITALSKYEWGLVKNPLKQKYYADVWGRLTPAQGDDPEAPAIIKDILEKELGQTVGSIPSYNDWKYAFTLDKKINSKKLIEEISSLSPYIPRFDNMGKFKMDVIEMEYPDGTDSHEINENDVIDFSFSRTKIEQVYTKVSLRYHWDYAKEDFLSSVEYNIESLQAISENPSNIEGDKYERSYYGFPTNSAGTYEDEVGYDRDADSTLIIEDDRGKYIAYEPYLSVDSTASQIVRWLLLWHCNQHLEMKVKLPLKYLSLEIGSIVNFSEILGGVKPYGINYKTGANINGQAFYKYFMITSTNKTLEFVEIECIQMHNLSNELTVHGCTQDAASNTINPADYPENTTYIDDGSCWYGDNELMDEYCAFPSGGLGIFYPEDVYEEGLTGWNGDPMNVEICTSNGGTWHHSAPIFGCMDASALNYNSSAVYDDPSSACIYPACYIDTQVGSEFDNIPLIAGVGIEYLQWLLPPEFPTDFVPQPEQDPNSGTSGGNCSWYMNQIEFVCGIYGLDITGDGIPDDINSFLNNVSYIWIVDHTDNTINGYIVNDLNLPANPMDFSLLDDLVNGAVPKYYTNDLSVWEATPHTYTTAEPGNFASQYGLFPFIHDYELCTFDEGVFVPGNISSEIEKYLDTPPLEGVNIEDVWCGNQVGTTRYHISLPKGSVDYNTFKEMFEAGNLRFTMWVTFTSGTWALDELNALTQAYDAYNGALEIEEDHSVAGVAGEQTTHIPIAINIPTEDLLVDFEDEYPLAVWINGWIRMRSHQYTEYDMGEWETSRMYRLSFDIEPEVEEGSGSELGDVNGDGGLNVLDVVLLTTAILSGDVEDFDGWSPIGFEPGTQAWAADLNGDGGYNILDVVALVNIILEG